MIRGIIFVIAGGSALGAGGASLQPHNGRQVERGASWCPANSRNCGDVVMPGIAETAKKNHAAFYWHLGDLRPSTLSMKTSSTSPNISRNRYRLRITKALRGPTSSTARFRHSDRFLFLWAWESRDDSPLKTREDFLLQFADWLDTPVLRAQRLRDNPQDHRLKTYFHWIDRGVAFYYLDSASAEQFDGAQMGWFERTLAKDLADPGVTAIVAGMHKALPRAFPRGTA